MALAVSSKGLGCRSVLRSSHRSSRPTRPVVARQSRKPVAVKAFLGDLFNAVGNGFVRIFSPPQDTLKDWKDTGSGYSGKIDRARGTPFNDGYQAGGVKTLKANETTADEASATVTRSQGADENPNLGYVGEALERVVGHNFKGDGTEPPAGTGSSGWKGDIHSGRRKDGFHSTKM